MTRMHELAAFLKAHDDYCLLAHVRPDGDAVGSCAALGLALTALGKRVCLHIPEGMPQSFQFLDCPLPVVYGGALPFEPRTAFAIDISDYRRMGEGTAIYEACAHSCMLDHHGTNPGFGDVFFIDGDAAATGELAVELIAELGVEMTPAMADWLYVAMAADSGQFSFASTRRETMLAAAACLAAGANVDRICQELFRTRSEGKTRLIGKVLSAMQMNADKTMAWSVLTDADYAAAYARREDNDSIVNYLLEIRGVQFACLAETLDGKSKFSLRSRGRINVAEIARELGGGGHAMAAGVTMEEPMDAALATVLARAQDALNGAE